MKGATTVKRSELAVAESGGLLSREMALSGIERLPKKFSPLSILDLTKTGLKIEKASYRNKEQITGINMTSNLLMPSNQLNISQPLNSRAVIGISAAINEPSQSVREEQKPKIEEQTSPITMSFLFPAEETYQGRGLATMEKIETSTTQKTRTQLGLKTKQVTGTLGKPEVGFNFKFPEETEIKLSTEKKEEKPQKKRKYLTLVKRYGKFKVLSSSETPQEAKRKGEAFTLSTLGASFAVKGEKGLLNLSSTERFRPSKKESKILVQRRGTRLATLGERREISLAKKGIRNYL
jgi:hypothetical protein